MVGGRPIKPQLVIVRPLIPQTGDVFGDASVLVSDTRAPAIRARMQVTWFSRRQAEQAFPGRSEDIKAMAVFRARDILDGATWNPGTNDLVEVAGVGSERISLFVVSFEPAYPVAPGLGNPSGGYAGWRIVLTSRTPNSSPATTYD